jgi:predicted nucleic acid-binding protein
MAARYKLEEVSLLQNKNIFVDANVLIYCFWETGSYRQERRYTKVFNELIHNPYHLFVDFIVISEIINRVLRIEQKKLQPDSNFKKFRDSEIGKNVLSDVFLIVKQTILPQFSIVGKVFSKLEIERLLTVDDLDFADKSTVEICKENSLVLLTNDKDFRNVDIDILTGNTNILRS